MTVGRASTKIVVGLLLVCAYAPVRLCAQTYDSIPSSGATSKLWDPGRAGRPLPPVGARDNTDAIQTLEKGLRCTCGCSLDVYTCRTTDFTCETSPAMHQRVLRLQGEGKSSQEIVAAFVLDNGISILMAPPKRGFNLAGYFVPAILILIASAVLVLVLRRWTRAGVPVPAAAGVTAVPASAAELEQLNRALRQEPD